jgi:hypothetical protein
MKEIEIKVTLEEANLIVEGLSKLPFINVYKLIEKIHLQAGKQIHTADQSETDQ